jgi:CMP-N,N'-diacetyllegionaminic acid synthase
MEIKKLVAHIPARAGSKRVKSKNLRMLFGKPMIAYAIECAKSCPDIDEIYVNTDCPTIGALAKDYGVNVFERDPTLASDTATGDDFTIDIIERLNIDTLLMISPVCPLITPEEVSLAIEAYRNAQSADTLISSEETTMQVAKEDGSFININSSGPLQPSQNNPKIHICNWAVTIWNGKIFKKNYYAFKGGYCGTNRILFPLDPNKSVKVSYEEDFRMVESLLAVDKNIITNSSPSYWLPS